MTRSNAVGGESDDIERATSALWALSPSCDYRDWIEIGMAARAAGLDCDTWIEWSRQAGEDSAKESTMRTKWRSFKPGGIGPGTLFKRAIDNGWTSGAPRRPVSAPRVKPKIKADVVVYQAFTQELLDRFNALGPVREIGADYLTARGCVIPPADGHLRYTDSALHPFMKKRGPALVSLITDIATGEPISLQTTWIKADGTKGDFFPPRMNLKDHRKSGGCIRLWPDEMVGNSLAVAEGTESALSLAHTGIPAWALIDAGNLAKLTTLPGIETLAIAVDNDESMAGDRAAEACAERWCAAGSAVTFYRPITVGQDLNDLVLGVPASDAQDILAAHAKKYSPASFEVEPEAPPLESYADEPALDFSATGKCPKPFPGPMEKLFELSCERQNRLQPELTVGAALCAMSACLHGRYALPDGLRGNLYVIGLAGTGSGKDAPMDIVRSLVEVAGGDAVSNIGSGQGIEEALRDSKDRRIALVIDEIAHTIGALTGDKAAAYMSNAQKMLLELYSSSSRTYVTRLLADKDKKPLKMFHPFLTMYGTTTHAKMQEIPPGLIEDGTLGRCLIMSGQDFSSHIDPPRGDPLYSALERFLGEKARRIFEFGRVMEKREDEITYIPFTTEAKAYIDRSREHFDGIAKKSDGAKRALCARAVEQMKRISLVLAVWDEGGTVGIEHAQWAKEMVEYSHVCLLSFVASMTDNPLMALMQRIEKIMRDAIAGKHPFAKQHRAWNLHAEQTGIVCHSALLKNAKKPLVIFRQAIDQMVEEGTIEYTEAETMSEKGKPITAHAYRLLI